VRVSKYLPPQSWSQILAAPAFIVNLEVRTDRLEISRDRIRRAGFTDVRRFPAINGWDAGDLRAAWQALGTPRLSHEEYGFVDKPGAQACLLSHLALWRKLIDEDVNYATIFEDDIVFAPGWADLAPRFYAATPKDFDLLYLGGNLHRPDRGYVVAAPTWGMQAYVVTKDGARHLHAAILSEKAGLRPVDVMLVECEWRDRFHGQPALFRWYAWNRTDYGQGPDLTSAAVEVDRGLVHQDPSLGSDIEVVQPPGSTP
jgi:hypothetical protein